MFVGRQQTVAAYLKTGGGADDAALCALTDGNDDAAAREELFLAGAGDVASSFISTFL